MLQFEMSPEEAFWQERTIRSIKESTSLEEVKEIAVLLTRIATTRQMAIKGLVKDVMELMQKQITHSIPD